MKISTTLASVLAISIFSLTMHAETIELINGDRLSGRLISNANGQVVLEHAVLGQLTLPVENVKVISADLLPAKDAGKPQPATPNLPAPEAPNAPDNADKIIKPKNEPNAMARLLAEWDSKLELGLNGSGGDSETQNVYLRFATKKQDGRNRWLIGGQYFLGRTDSETKRNQAEVKVTRDWLQKDSPWFLFARSEYKYDQFRSWEHRISAYGGGGYTLIDDGTFEVIGRAGLGGTHEFGDVDEWTPEAIFSGSAAKWNIDKRQTLGSELTYYPSLEAVDDFRIQGKIWWQYKLNFLDGLSLKIGAEDEYDATPDKGDEEHDFKYYGALVIEF